MSLRGVAATYFFSFCEYICKLISYFQRVTDIDVTSFYLIFIFSFLVLDLQPVQYLIEVFTADVAHAGTDANVSILLYGANGDTGQRQLTKKFVNLFERGKVDDFKIEALDLGQLTRLRIEHDNKGFGAGWMLEKVDITNLTSQEKVTFPCSQWLDKKKGDGKICRDLLPLTK